MTMTALTMMVPERKMKPIVKTRTVKLTMAEMVTVMKTMVETMMVIKMTTMIRNVDNGTKEDIDTKNDG